MPSTLTFTHRSRSTPHCNRAQKFLVLFTETDETLARPTTHKPLP